MKITIVTPANTLEAVLEVAERFGAVTVTGAETPGWHVVSCTTSDEEASALESFGNWANQFIALSPTVQRPNPQHLYPYAKITDAN